MSHEHNPAFGTVQVNATWKISIIRSVWYPELTNALTKDAADTLIALGIGKDSIRIVDAPGSYELPILCKTALETGSDGVIAFGVVVQGGTHHARLVAEESAAGCMRVQLDAGKPVTFEVLYVDSLDDARVRSVGEKGKGSLAAKTLLSCLARQAELRS